MAMNIDNIDQMNTEEKLQVIDALWTSLLKKEENIASPDWHGEIISKRLEALEKGETKLYNLDQLKNMKF